MKRQNVRLALILISFLFFPVTIYYLSPYLIIDGASQGIITGSFILFGVLFLASLFSGRVFCGWLCPAGGLQEASFPVNQNRVLKGNWIKYLIWVPWMVMIILTAISSKGFRSMDPFFQTDHGISVTEPQSYIIYYAVIGLIAILAFTVGRRSFCHHVCWIAPFMIIGNKLRSLLQWPALHLEANPANCSHCKSCTKSCPMSLEVEEMVAKKDMGNAECILCGNCIDVCTKKAIQFGFLKKSDSKRSSTIKATNSFDRNMQ